MMDFTDRVIDFIVEEYLSGKLTEAQVARLVQAFDQSSAAERPVLGRHDRQDPSR
jgi:hypothetical protein